MGGCEGVRARVCVCVRACGGLGFASLASLAMLAARTALVTPRTAAAILSLRTSAVPGRP